MSLNGIKRNLLIAIYHSKRIVLRLKFDATPMTMTERIDSLSEQQTESECVSDIVVADCQC